MDQHLACGADHADRSDIERPEAVQTTCVVGRSVSNPAPETQRAYSADWSSFVAWCRRQSLSALPASPAAVLAYLLDGAPRLGRGTLRRRRAAIAAMHRGQDLPVPLLDRKGTAALRQAARHPEPKPVSNSKPVVLVRMAAVLRGDMAGLRDRAMLLLLAAAGQGGTSSVTRAALLGLDVEHVRFTDAGAELRLRARADEQEPTLLLPLMRSATPAGCPVRALEDWLRISNTAYGPIFRKVDRWGGVEHARLGPDAWRRIMMRRTGKARSVRRG